MIVEKKISFNYDNMDEVILELAEEINKGFTISYIERLPYTLSIKQYDDSASMIICLRRKERGKS